MKPVLTLALIFCGGMAGADDSKSNAFSKYEAAVKAAEQRFSQSVDEARARLQNDLQAARRLLEAADKASTDEAESNYIVAVSGTDPKPLVESHDGKGWSEVPEITRRAIIFENRDDEPNDGVLEFRVLRDNRVWIAASWAYDGNPGGGWKEERKTKQQLEVTG